MTVQGGDVQKTHLCVSAEFVGQVERIESGKSSRVSLTVNSKMRVDEKGLAHGGFAFGLADYAAMVAVNDPYVVLLSSQARFLKPVIVGDRLEAQAEVTDEEGKKRKVHCEVFNQDRQKVFEGEFLCLVLTQHLLDKRID
ncbi:MAG: PaaI family thioesterase [Syntrophaceae bacterium]|nr:PaaI family thioesterase [Syntrophaceae bacterium]